MSDQKKLAAVRDLIESAQKSISAARKIIATLAGEGQSIPDLDTE
jgi:hypothetical protein